MKRIALAVVALAVVPATASAAPGDLVYKDCTSSNTNIAACSQLAVSAAGGTNTAMDGVTAAVEAPGGAQVYAVASNSSTISWFNRGAATGALTLAGCLSASTAVTSCTSIPGATGDGTFSGMGSPTALAITPDGRSVFVSSSADDALARFTRDPATGALSGFGCTSSNTGVQTKCTIIGGANATGDDTALSSLSDVVVSPDGANVYTAANRADAISRFGRNPTTGAFTGFQDCLTSDTDVSAGGSCAQIAGASANGTGHRMNGLSHLAAPPDGKSIVGTSAKAVVDFTRGVGGVLGVGSCVSSDTSTAGCAGTFGNTNGGSGTALDNPSDVTISPNSDNVYVSSSFGDAVSVLGRNTTTGALEGFEGCRTSNTTTIGCSFDPGAVPPPTTTHLTGANAVAVSPNSATLYAVSGFGDAVTRNDRRATDGAFFFKDCTSSNTEVSACTRITPNVASGSNTPLNNLGDVVASSDGKDVYAINLSDAIAHLEVEGSRPPVTPPGGDDDPPGGAAPPSNDITIGAVDKNKKKGTALLAVTVPGAGAVDLAGNGLKPQATTAAAAGDLALKVKTTGNKRKKLHRKGKAKVTPLVTFTPTGGTANTESTRVKLVDR